MQHADNNNQNNQRISGGAPAQQGAHAQQPQQYPQRPSQGQVPPVRPNQAQRKLPQGQGQGAPTPQRLPQGHVQSAPVQRANHVQQRSSVHQGAPSQQPYRTSPAASRLTDGLEERYAQEAQQRAAFRHAHQPKRKKPNFITRIVNAWFNRVMGAVAEGSLADQEEEYEAHSTSRDYIWNSIGSGAWGMVFPVLTIVATQLVGAEQAGMFSMAFVTGLLLMFVANYGVRTYQVSDVEEKHSFSEYQINRYLTCIIMLVVGFVYCQIRGYDAAMMTICTGVFIYKMIDGLADVYEGRLQQVDKLYLAGVSQAVRSVAVLVVFSVALFISRNIGFASMAMGVTAVITFVVLTLPLALLETPKSKSRSMSGVVDLFRQCFPLFVALFMYNLIDNMPKFVMEGLLPYENQLYFNALYFPAMALLIVVQLVYKPQLLRLTNIWNDPEKRMRFDLIIVAMLVLILGLTLGLMVVMGTVGIPVMSFMYGIDFEEFRGLTYVMVAAGGVTAAIDFLYQIITVLRRQQAVMKLYLITFFFALFVPFLLIGFTGLAGAVLSYLIVMSILMVLLLWQYASIRMSIFRNEKREREEEDGATRMRPSEARAARERLAKHRGEGMSKARAKDKTD